MHKERKFTERVAEMRRRLTSNLLTQHLPTKSEYEEARSYFVTKSLAEVHNPGTRESELCIPWIVREVFRRRRELSLGLLPDPSPGLSLRLVTEAGDGDESLKVNRP
ncbi:hypothetical protein K458DRAFT_420912 [Lentithecium fluviatile CBS 122367]|uniref:Uncharacterized protein n=1 Tax=Lentithecium fluviatile CBS 122367 TaxID=1168545 RepID=A0A6G1IRV6_9PLEO|nr:hypothetical protein K458DRAFT_420912 [Lentithecium fluviatile CBS 122367]